MRQKPEQQGHRRTWVQRRVSRVGLQPPQHAGKGRDRVVAERPADLFLQTGEGAENPQLRQYHLQEQGIAGAGKRDQFVDGRAIQLLQVLGQEPID